MSSVNFEIRDNIGFITLNRPEKLNSFTREMALLLQNRLDECASLHEVRAVYLTGAGRAFSAGQDLSEIVGSGEAGTGEPGGTVRTGLEDVLSELYNPIITRIRNLPKPVVAAVGGVAAGAGANIALCCDIVLASRSASFIQAFSRIGLIPDSGGTYFLPRLVGWQKAAGIAFLGDKIGATEAERIGMIYKVYEDEEFAGGSKALTAVLAQMPTRALAFTKHALNYSTVNSLEAQLLLEDELQQKAARTSDYGEGVRAFLEKERRCSKGNESLKNQYLCFTNSKGTGRWSMPHLLYIPRLRLRGMSSLEKMYTSGPAPPYAGTGGRSSSKTAAMFRSVALFIFSPGRPFCYGKVRIWVMVPLYMGLRSGGTV